MKIEDLIKTQFISSQQKALVNLRYTSNFVGNIQHDFMNEFELTMAQFNILRILRGAKKAINVNTVKERMIEKSPNTTRLMDKLIEKGLIERTRCSDDRRIVFAHITQAGLDILDEIDAKSQNTTLIPYFLSDNDAEVLSNLLDKLRNGYQEL
jgi:MarR family 2-MHQ and catechol resistance regulon transcriptional repressor